MPFVGAAYTSNAGQTITSGSAAAIIDFEDEVYDSDDAVTVGAAWKFTAPSDGQYHIDVFIMPVSVVGDGIGAIALYKNGILFYYLDEIAWWDGDTGIAFRGSVTIQLSITNTIDIRIGQDSDGNMVLSNQVRINIERVQSAGATGAQGATGPGVGTTGATGPTGPSGASFTGATGPTGPTGPGITPDGWSAISGTFTYASATTINVSSGATAIYSVGDKIRFQNNDSGTYLYAYIVAIADTLLTIVGAAVPSATLTDAYYSKAETPLDFPSQFAWTPTPTNITFGSGALTCNFSLHGRTVFFNFKWIFGAGSAVSGDFSFTLPIASAIDATAKCRILDTGNTWFQGYAAPSGAGCSVRCINASSTYAYVVNLSSTVPMTWTTGDGIYISGSYLI
jgi:hypothetical protein